MRYRVAGSSDAAAIARVHVTSWRATYRGLVPDGYLAQLSVASRARTWSAILSDHESGSVTFVAEDEAENAVGFASGGPERTGDPIHMGELYALYVLPEWHGCGIGRHLVTRIAARLIGDGKTTMVIWVFADNPARRFYERLGGTPVGAKTVTLGFKALVEVAYGWENIHSLARPG